MANVDTDIDWLACELIEQGIGAAHRARHSPHARPHREQLRSRR